MPARNVNLTEHYDELVEQFVASGRFKNASEVMRAGLRPLEQEASEECEKLKLLRSLAAEGFEQLDQGQGIDLEDEQMLTRDIGAIGRRAAKGAKRRNNGG